MLRLTVAGIWTLIGGGVAFILHDLLPSYAKDAIKQGICGFLDHRKHERELFMLKAIGHNAHGNIVGVPFTLEQIEHKLTMFQIEETYGGQEAIAGAFFEQLDSEQKRKIEKRHKKIQRLGIPDAEDVPSTARLKKIEQLLQEMVRDNKLRFQPPDSYSVL